jgi:hypothetical protein
VDDAGKNSSTLTLSLKADIIVANRNSDIVQFSKGELFPTITKYEYVVKIHTPCDDDLAPDG